MGELFRVEHGFAFKGEHFSETGDYVVLTPGNFHEAGGFRPRPGKDRYYQGKFPDRYLLNQNDLIVAMTEQGEGLLGSSAFIPESGKYLHNQRLGLVRVKRDAADKTFLYYLFNADYVRQQIRNSSSGAKVRHTSPERIYRVKVLAPSKRCQQKIAAILSAYDDLIENNKRRIVLLEKMAEEIYCEWFVRLRFPGHEKVKLVKGVPEDWQLSTLGAICSIKGGKRLPKGHSLVDQKTDHPYIKSRDIKGGAIKGTELQFVEDSTFEKINRYIVNQGNICITIVANIGDVGTVPAFLDGACLTENAVKLTNLKQGISSMFLACTLSMRHYKEYMELLAAGAAQSKLGLYKIKSIKLWIPPRELMDIFDAQIGPLRKQVQLLEESNKSLQTSRDLLLPRLISGKLSVENLDIQFPPSMAEEAETGV